MLTNRNPAMADVGSARRSRGQLASRADISIRKFVDMVQTLWNRQPEPIPLVEVALAEASMEPAMNRFQAFADSVARCQLLEELTEEEALKDPFTTRKMDMEDDITQARARLNGLRQMVSHPNPTTEALTNNAPPTSSGNEAPIRAHQSHRTFKFSHLEPLSQEASHAEYKRWRETWDNNARVHKLASFEREVQVYSVMTAMGPYASRIIKNHFQTNLNDEETTVDGILENLQRYYRSQRSVALDRVNFHQRKQDQSETFDQFRFAITDLAKDAELCTTCVESQIVTQIIIGTKDEKARHDMLEERKFPSLGRTIEICQANEVASRNQASLTNSSVHKISTYRQGKKKGGERDRNQPRDQNQAQGKNQWPSNKREGNCWYCGQDRHSRKECPAKNQTCSFCHKQGHIQVACKSKKYGRQPDERGRISSVFCGRVCAKGEPFCDLATISIKFSDHLTKAGNHISSSARHGGGSKFDVKIHFRQDPKQLSNTNDTLYAANNLTISSMGRAKFGIHFNGRSCEATFIISDEFNGTILSLQTCRELNLIHKEFPNPLGPEVSISYVEESPAEIVYGHPLRSRVPAHHRSFDPKWLKSMDEYDKKTTQIQLQTTKRYNASSRVHLPIQIGSTVNIQNQQSKVWDRSGVVVSKGMRRNYRIRLPSGRCIWRNRRHLRLLTNENPEHKIVEVSSPEQSLDNNRTPNHESQQ
eukprot:TCALIF_12231-PA protein Name:"Protein of unknown function" AED:0.22 eAED:0.28 QI:0/0/0/0.8/0.25/0.2/5/0/703